MAVETVRGLADRLRTGFGQVLVGQGDAIEHLILALLLEGHVLLQGVPGVAKTLLVRTFGLLLGAEFHRIQFTPDMMPSDIIGTNVFDPCSAEFHVRRGPVFCNLLLADEINRTPPKTQAALLEVMEERQATIEGVAHPLAWPFLVCATINPIEFEGTYPLPEAQLDRFLFQVELTYPDPDDERELLRRVDQGFDARQIESLGLKPVSDETTLRAAMAEVQAVSVSEPVLEYLHRLVLATRESMDLLLGASPRAAIALLRASKARAATSGREFVLPDDLKAVCRPVLRHRLVLRPETEIEGRRPDDVLSDVLDEVEVPLDAEP